jgi:hypothetical protein
VASIINQEVKYKLGTPMYDSDPDWSITLSQIEFPWKEVRFGEFSALECYQKYK